MADSARRMGTTIDGLPYFKNLQIKVGDVGKVCCVFLHQESRIFLLLLSNLHKLKTFKKLNAFYRVILKVKGTHHLKKQGQLS